MPPSSPRSASPPARPLSPPSHHAHPVADTYTYISPSSLTDSFVAVSPVPSSAMASPILAPTGATSGLRVHPPTYADVVKGVSVATDAAATPRGRRDAPSIDEDEDERTPVAGKLGNKIAERGLMSKGKDKTKTKTKADADADADENKQVSLTGKVLHVAFDKFFSHFLHGFLFGALANLRYEVQLAGGLWRMMFRRPLPPPTVGQMADPRMPRRLPAGW